VFNDGTKRLFPGASALLKYAAGGVRRGRLNRRWVRAEGDLERLLRRPVQVVVLNSAPVDLVHRILRNGRVVFEGDRSARIAFEVKARSEYFDLLPILRRYRRLERAAL
jgi:hypothetical protein